MAEEKRFAKATWAIMEQLLEVDNLEDALSGALEIIVELLHSEAGAIWFLDSKTDSVPCSISARRIFPISRWRMGRGSKVWSRRPVSRS